MNRHLSKEDVANKDMQRCLRLFVIKKLQIKTTMRYHYISIRMAKIKKNLTMLIVWSNRNSYLLLEGMQNGTATLEDSLAVS